MKRFGKMMLRAGLAAMALGMAGSAEATTFVENALDHDTYGDSVWFSSNAQHLLHDGTIYLTGFAAPGLTNFLPNAGSAHDWYSFGAAAGDTITISVNAISPTATGDPFIALMRAFTPGVLEIDDDDGPGVNSLINYSVTTSGTYLLGVGEYFDDSPLYYELIVTGLTPSIIASGVPEPATWAMMLAGFGLVGGALRRGQAGRVRVTKVGYSG
jgi:hypothetical protein